jgi:hypothetical protein
LLGGEHLKFQSGAGLTVTRKGDILTLTEFHLRPEGIRYVSRKRTRLIASPQPLNHFPRLLRSSQVFELRVTKT